METHSDKDASVGSIRREALREVIEDANQLLAVGRGDHMLTELRKHINVVFQQVARLKLVDGSSLSTAGLAMEVNKEDESNASRLNHMRVVADSMFYLNENIKLWNVPQFELPTGFHALVEGKMDFYPSVFDELVHPCPLPSSLSKNLLSSVSNRILSLVEKIDLRHGIVLESVWDGVAWFVSPREFRVSVTLTQAPPSVQPPYERHIPSSKNNCKTSPVPLKIEEEKSRVEDMPGLCVGIPDGCFETEDDGDGLWWWSLTGLVICPVSETKSAFLEEFQVEYLRREFDARMISMASSIADQRRQHLPPKKKPSTPLTGGVLPSQPCLEDDDRDDQTEPLNLLFDMARDAASRVALNLVRLSLKRVVEDDSPFRRLSRLVASRVLRPGYRLYYWTGVPVVVDCLLEDRREDKKWKEVRPWIEIGMGESGSVEIQHFPELPTSAAEQLRGLRVPESYSDLSQLIMECSSALSRPLLSTLLSEIESLAISLGHQELHTELFENRDNASVMGSELKAVGCNTSPELRVSLGDVLLLKLSVSLMHGRLSMECSDPLKAHSAKTFQKWEDRMNRLWKRRARSLTTESSHPHIAALGHVARLVLSYAQRFSAGCQGDASPRDDLLCVKHGVVMPIELPPALTDGLDPETRGCMHDSERTLNFPLKELIFQETNDVEMEGMGTHLRAQIVLSLSGASGDPCVGSLAVVSLDARGAPQQVLAVTPVPKRLLVERRQRTTAKKRKQEDADSGPTSKREKHAEDMNGDILEQMTQHHVALDARSRRFGPVQHGGTGPFGASVEFLTADVENWCCWEGLFEVLRAQLNALSIDSEEEFVASEGTGYRHYLRLSGRNTDAWVAFLKIADVRIEVAEGGSEWIAVFESKRFSDPLFPVLEGMDTPLPSAEGNTSHGSVSKGVPSYLHDQTWGRAWRRGNLVGMTYKDNQPIGHLLADMSAIQATQTALDTFHRCTSVIGKKRLTSSNEGRVNAAVTQIGLTNFTLSVSCVTGEEGDQEVLVSWMIQYCSKRPNKPSHKGDTSMRMGTSKHVTQGLSTTPDPLKSTVSERPNTDRNHGMTPLRSMTGGDVPGIGLACQIQCDTAVPAILLDRFDELIQTGQTSKFLLAIRLTASALHYIQGIWRFSSWLLHALPQSSALNWCFFCIKGKIERTLTLRFHESGFLFIRVVGGKNGHQQISDVVNCQSLEKMEGFVDIISSVLSASEEQPNQKE